MHAAVICREFGWTYEEYLDQPKDFLDIIALMLKNKAEVAEIKSKQS